jgi:DNA-binding XRE family transcriptional regulator
MTNKSVTSRHNQVTKKREVSPFGRELVKARNKVSWTQEVLRTTAKLHKNTITNIETGKVTESLETRRILIQVINEEHLAQFKCLYPWDGEADTITLKSIEFLVKNSELENKITYEIAAACGLEAMSPDSFMELLLKRMPAVGISSISEINKLLRERHQLIIHFGICCCKNKALRPPFVSRGIGIFCLQIMLMLEKHSIKGLTIFLKEYSPDKRTNYRERARQMNLAYQQARHLFHSQV